MQRRRPPGPPRWPRPRTGCSRAWSGYRRRPQGGRGGAPGTRTDRAGAPRPVGGAGRRRNKQLPEEFLNSDALEKVDLGEMLEDSSKSGDLRAEEAMLPGRFARHATWRRSSPTCATGCARRGRTRVDEQVRKALERLEEPAQSEDAGSQSDRQRALLERHRRRSSGRPVPAPGGGTTRDGPHPQHAAPPAQADLLTAGGRRGARRPWRASRPGAARCGTGAGRRGCRAAGRAAFPPGRGRVRPRGGGGTHGRGRGAAEPARARPFDPPRARRARRAAARTGPGVAIRSTT